MSDDCMNIGAGRSEIKIPAGFFPYRGIRGRLYTGQHDSLNVRCILLKNAGTGAILVSIEVGDIGDVDVWIDRVSQASGVSKSNVFITVTHNHEAPHLSDSYNQPTVDADKTALFNGYVHSALLESIDIAKQTSRPGRIGFGTGTCDINVNRNQLYEGKYIIGIDSHGPSDKTVAVVKFEDLNGTVIAYFINYAVHGCAMFDTDVSDGGMLVGGDIPGETSRYIESRLGNGAVALWTSGAAGDQNPKYMAKRNVFDGQGKIRQIDAKSSGYLLVEVMAETLADEVLAVGKGIRTLKNASIIKGMQKEFVAEGKKKAQNPFAVPADYEYPDGDAVSVRLGVLLLGNVALVCVPGELVCSIGLKLKDSIPYRNVAIVTHCNGSLSYMSDDSGFDRKTFEALVSHFKRGSAEKAVVEGASSMLCELLNHG